MTFLYELNQPVKVTVNGVSETPGIVMGRAEYVESVNQYVISYDNGNSADWFLEADIKS